MAQHDKQESQSIAMLAIRVNLIDQAAATAGGDDRSGTALALSGRFMTTMNSSFSVRSTSSLSALRHLNSLMTHEVGHKVLEVQ